MSVLSPSGALARFLALLPSRWLPIAPEASGWPAMGIPANHWRRLTGTGSFCWVAKNLCQTLPIGCCKIGVTDDQEIYCQNQAFMATMVHATDTPRGALCQGFNPR